MKQTQYIHPHVRVESYPGEQMERHKFFSAPLCSKPYKLAILTHSIQLIPPQSLGNHIFFLFTLLEPQWPSFLFFI